jgi:hypothetical protein
MKNFGLHLSSIAFVCLMFAAVANAESVTPTQGQSAEQTQKDITECQGIAKQSTGVDPAQVSAPPPPSAPEAGGRVRGAAAGAAAGAVAAEVRGQQHEEVYDRMSDDAKQEYRQNQAKETAAAGAVVGASRQRQNRRENRRAEQAQAEQANTALSAFDQAYRGCLAGRGYTVTP